MQFNGKRLTIWALLATLALPVLAQDEPATKEKDPWVDISFNMRGDFSAEWPKTGGSTAGFHGSFLNLILKGDLGHGLSYNFRQRLNKFPKEAGNDIFYATDFVYLTYRPTKNWAVSAGKQIVAIGGWEYDAPPIDIYYSSLFWQNIACYQFGVSGTYTSNNGHHNLTAQFCNSPYNESLGDKRFAYNLMWSANVKWWHPLWSVNFFDYGRGDFCQYYMLGNRFDMGPVTLDVDLLNRHHYGTSFLKNWGVVGKLDYRVCKLLTVMVKGGYDRFDGDALKPTVTSATTDAAGNEVETTSPFVSKKPFASAGVEVRPIKKYPGIRLHAMYGLTTYEGEYQQNMMVGLTWNCNVYKTKK